MRGVLATLVIATLGMAHETCAAGALCKPGRFLIYGQAVGPNPGPKQDSVTLTDTDVAIASCRPVAPRLKPTRLGTSVRAHWKTCGTMRDVRLRATIIRPACNELSGTLTWAKNRRGRVRQIRYLSATRREPSTITSCSLGQATYDVIQDRLFGGHGCTVATCHGAFAQGGLDLTAGGSYENLVGVTAANPVAAADGTLRVVPGDPGTSFLVRKLRGSLATGEGDAMPRFGNPLDADELAVLEAWISAGAPRTGRVPDAPCLPPVTFVPATPLPPPTDGYQVVFDGPTLYSGEERELCLWVPTPNPTDFVVGSWEFSLNPGSHHFAVFQWDKDTPPPLGTPGLDPGCTSGAMFGATLSGTPQTPYWIDRLPDGVARVLPAGGFLGLNAHYANEFEEPIQMKVWVNVHGFSGTPAHLVQTVTDFDEMLHIDVPPGTQRLLKGRFANSSATPMAIVQLIGHMHKRGLRFTARDASGNTLLENLDWAHPYWKPFSPPLRLGPGEYIDYECLHDNGVTRPPKLDYAGNPTELKFGVTTDDEMCALSATWYPDAN